MAKLAEKIGFIGSGKMAAALLGAVLQDEVVAPEQVLCSDISDERLDELKQKYGVGTTRNNGDVFRFADFVILAVKPQNFPQAIESAASLVRPEQVIISIMAGVHLERLRQYLPARVVRVMPNTAALVGEMAAGYTPADNVTGADLEKVQFLLQSAGMAVKLPEEALDAVTGLSGSGPAFVAYLLEGFIRAGREEGLDEAVAKKLALETFAGTARLLKIWDIPPRELIDMVSSPNGTTVAGRQILESSDVQEIIVKTIRRAAARSRELGKPKGNLTPRG